MLSIIRFYGGNIPLEKIKLDTLTAKDGTSAFHIIEAFKKYGFDAVGKKVPLKDLNDNLLPVIAHVQIDNVFKHYVVIYKINYDKEKIGIMDPAIGIKEITFKEFLKVWNNVIIQVYPQSKTPLFITDHSLTSLIVNLLKTEKENILKLVAISSLFSIFTIFNSFYFKVILNNTNNSLTCLIWLIILYLILTCLKVILGYFRDYYENILNKNIDVKLMLFFLNHLFKLPLNIINNRTTGEIVTRVKEINSIKNIFSKCFVTLFLDLLLVVIAFFILINISYKLFFLLLMICIIYILIGIISNSTIYKKVTETIELETGFNNLIIDHIDSFLTIKTLNQNDYIMRKIENQYCYSLKTTFDFNMLLLKCTNFKNLVNDLGLSLIISYGCYMIYNNNLNLVNLIMFNTLLIYFINPIKNFINLLPQISYLKASMQKINEFIFLEEEKNVGTYTSFVNGNIKFENVCYSYNKYHYIYKNFNLNIIQGSKIMIKGASGSGKSTICKLLYRIYNCDKGNIKIGNINILDYNLNTLRNNITYLAQKEKLFNDTIYNNIVLDKKVTTCFFNYIAQICMLNPIIDNKPLRFETQVIPEYNFSGGEVQRILLARALLKDTPILILDEALSEVDQQLEKIILKNIIREFKDKTIIYISHRNNEELFDQIIRFTKNVSVL